MPTVARWRTACACRWRWSRPWWTSCGPRSRRRARQPSPAASMPWSTTTRSPPSALCPGPRRHRGRLHRGGGGLFQGKLYMGCPEPVIEAIHRASRAPIGNGAYSAGTRPASASPPARWTYLLRAALFIANPDLPERFRLDAPPDWTTAPSMAATSAAYTDYLRLAEQPALTPRFLAEPAGDRHHEPFPREEPMSGDQRQGRHHRGQQRPRRSHRPPPGAKAGAKLVLGARREECSQLRDAIVEQGGEAIYRVTDVTDRDQVEAPPRRQEAYGRIDVLVNNAGLMPLSPLISSRSTSGSRWSTSNIKGVLAYCRGAADHARAACRPYHQPPSVAGHVVSPRGGLLRHQVRGQRALRGHLPEGGE